MRVRLDKSIPTFTLSVRGGCLVDDDQGNRLLPPINMLNRCVVRPDPQGPNGVLFGDAYLPGPVVRVLPDEDGTLVYQDRRYRGYLVAKREGSGFLVINVVDVESYLRGVLGGELPRYFHPETYRVQAIVSRTFALYQRYLNGQRRAWDVTADTSSQVYRGVEGEGSKSNDAVDATLGLVCAWDSAAGRKIFCTYFSSTCGGMNQNVVNVKGGASIGPLSGGVRCKYCAASEWYKWPTVRLDKGRITRDLKPFLVNGGYTHAEKLGRMEDIKILSKTPSKRAIRLRLIDKNGLVVDMRAEDFRLLVDKGRLIKSTQFEVSAEPNCICFRNGRGYGHGIGLCQHGAEGMARRGAKAGPILQHYYPGCVLVKAY
jgi:stage II sporulation protein D